MAGKTNFVTGYDRFKHCIVLYGALEIATYWSFGFFYNLIITFCAVHGQAAWRRLTRTAQFKVCKQSNQSYNPLQQRRRTRTPGRAPSATLTSRGRERRRRTRRRTLTETPPGWAPLGCILLSLEKQLQMIIFASFTWEMCMIKNIIYDGHP